MFTYAWARPDVPDAKVHANTLLNTFEASYPFRRALTQTVRGSLGLDFVNQDVKLDGIDLTRDRLRVAFARLGADVISRDFSRPYTSLVEPLWRMVGQVELRKGLSIFGATDYCDPTEPQCNAAGVVPAGRPEGRPTAMVFRSNFYGEVRPVRNLTVSGNVRGQASSKPLMSFEEFSVGNYTIGRGYDPGTLVGDSGIGTQVEVRFGSRIPRAADRPAFEAYAFWDYAKVGNRDKLTVLDQSNHLHSVGGGARIGFSRFALDAAVAFPLTTRRTL